MRARVTVAVGIVVGIVVAACTPPPPPPPAEGPVPEVMTILPPGNGDLLGPTRWNNDDQRAMYDLLDDPVADGTLTDTELARYYKDADLGDPDPDPRNRSEAPRPNTSVVWDAYGVPHVTGATSEDVAFGAGWAMAEGRTLLLLIGRELGRLGVLESIGGGASILDVITRINELPRVSYTEAELQQAIDDAIARAAQEQPGEAAKITAAVDAYVEGINAYLETNPPLGQPLTDLLEALGKPVRPEPWKRSDLAALGTVVNNIFGTGGGDELGNAALLQVLEARFGADQGRAVFDDLRMRDVRRAGGHVPGVFRYPLFAGPGEEPTHRNTVDAAAVAMVDPAEVEMVAGYTPPEPAAMSNHLLVNPRDGSAPVMVGGPQAGYFYMELVMEMELRGGGYDAAGVTFPGIGPWIAIGHSDGYAWTATSGNSDQVDQRVEKLCDSVAGVPHYQFQGRCVAMTRPDDQPLTMWRTVHGLVMGWGEVDGQNVAIVRQRASFLQEPDAAYAFWRLSRGEVDQASEFAETMRYVPMSFNWSYLNRDDIAYFHSGRYPVRARGVDFDLPSWGTGEWEWQGIVDWRRHPQGVNPPSGVITSWNDKVAKGWSASDNDWGYGEVQRVDLLRTRARGLARTPGLTTSEVVAAHQDAATADLRAEEVVPELLKVLEGSSAPTPALEQLRGELARYAADAHRRDRNYDGWYDDPMTPVVDNLWEPLVLATFSDVLGPAVTDPAVRKPHSLDNAPSSIGSAFQDPAWYSIEYRELRRARGVEARPTGVPAMCGGGDLAACQHALWGALEEAYWKTRGQQLVFKQDMTRWTKPTLGERLFFLPYVGNLNSMRWVNRPTYEQVVRYHHR